MLIFWGLSRMGIKIADLLSLMTYKAFRGKTGEEDNLAIAVATMLRVASIEGRLRATWTCIPHEVGALPKENAQWKVAQSRYAKAKAKGLIAGSTDYVFVWEGGGGWIELKTASGSLSPAQRIFRDWCKATGCHWAVCRTVDEVVDTLVLWRVLRK